MKTMLLQAFAATSAIALLGAGCAAPVPAPIDEAKPVPSVSEPVKTPETSIVPTETPAEPATSSAPAESSKDRTSELPVIDATWKTYTNSALKFSFQWPTRGRYAPEWDVSVYRPEDARLVGNCSKPEAAERLPNGSLTVGDAVFCVVHEVDAGAGQRVFIDTYTAPRAEYIIKVRFMKRLANGDLFDDPACKGKAVISAGTSCIPFDDELYRAHLNQIISTYRHE